MSTFKKTKVIILSTNEKASGEKCSILLGLGSNKLFLQREYDDSSIPQHLYFLSDKDIKEGDWYYDSKNNRLGLAKSNYEGMEFINKIIASTDPSLKFGEDVPGIIKYKSLPSPSRQFIDVYIEEYNKGKQITDVMVEYETFKSYSGNNGLICKDHLKVNLKDNTIIIKKIKDSWNRDEVISLLKEYRSCLLPITEREIQITNDFIKTNL